MYRGEKAHQITFSILLPSSPLPSHPPTREGGIQIPKAGVRSRPNYSAWPSVWKWRPRSDAWRELRQWSQSDTWSLIWFISLTPPKVTDFCSTCCNQEECLCGVTHCRRLCSANTQTKETVKFSFLSKKYSLLGRQRKTNMQNNFRDNLRSQDELAGLAICIKPAFLQSILFHAGVFFTRLQPWIFWLN